MLKRRCGQVLDTPRRQPRHVAPGSWAGSTHSPSPWRHAAHGMCGACAPCAWRPDPGGGRGLQRYVQICFTWFIPGQIVQYVSSRKSRTVIGKRTDLPCHSAHCVSPCAVLQSTRVYIRISHRVFCGRDHPTTPFRLAIDVHAESMPACRAPHAGFLFQ